MKQKSFGKTLSLMGIIIILAACAPKIVVIPAPTLTSSPIGVDTATPQATASFTPPPTDTPSPTISPTPTATATPSFLESYPAEGYGPVNFPENINPLTGLLVDPAQLARRPIAAKISHYPRGVRPNWGLSLADHVFEYYHEGGLTRFNAIFYGNNAELIGPIRSARFSDKDIVEMYDALFAFAGADPRVRTRLAYANFASRMIGTVSEQPCPPSAQFPLCRAEQDAWNHLLGGTTAIHAYFASQGVDDSRQNLDGLRFNPIPPEDGQNADSLLVRYAYGSYHRWDYDPVTQKYYRQQDVSDAEPNAEVFEPMLDRLNNQPITADNVVVLFAPHAYFRVAPEIIEIPFDGFGKAYLFRNGAVYLVNWSRVANGDLLILANDLGEKFPLKPGNTWFVVIGKNSLVQQASPDWRFQHFPP